MASMLDTWISWKEEFHTELPFEDARIDNTGNRLTFTIREK